MVLWVIRILLLFVCGERDEKWVKNCLFVNKEYEKMVFGFR